MPPVIDIRFRSSIYAAHDVRQPIKAHRLTPIDIRFRDLHDTHADIDIRKALIDIRLRFRGRAPLLLPLLPLGRRPLVADLVI